MNVIKQLVIFTISLFSVQYSNAQISEVALQEYSNDEVRAYMQLHLGYLKYYLIALENQNEIELMKIAKSSETLANKISQIGIELTPKDIQLMTEYSKNMVARILSDPSLFIIENNFIQETKEAYFSK